MAQWIDADGMLVVGQVGFLSRTSTAARGGARETYSLQPKPVCTNLSGEERLFGWCGETNNVSEYAEGMARVVRVTRDGYRALVVSLHGADLSLALDAAGYSDLDPTRKNEARKARAQAMSALGLSNGDARALSNTMDALSVGLEEAKALCKEAMNE